MPHSARALFTTFAAVGSAPVNVKSFGAVGDGTADDRAAFLAAIAAASVDLVPPGNYRLSSSITLSKDVSIIALGRTLSRWAPATGGRIIKPDGSAYAFVSPWDTVTDLEILRFEGNGLDGPCSGRNRACGSKQGAIGIRNGRVVRIVDCSFHDLTTAGIQRLISDYQVDGSTLNRPGFSGGRVLPEPAGPGS